MKKEPAHTGPYHLSKTNVLLQWYEGLDNKPVIIKCSQIMTVDRNDIVRIVDILRPEDEIRLNEALKVSLALGNYEL